MASLRALSGTGTWTFSSDIRSYLLCCFSSSPSHSGRRKRPTSDTESEHLNDDKPIEGAAADGDKPSQKTDVTLKELEQSSSFEKNDRVPPPVEGEGNHAIQETQCTQEVVLGVTMNRRANSEMEEFETDLQGGQSSDVGQSETLPVSQTVEKYSMVNGLTSGQHAIADDFTDRTTKSDEERMTAVIDPSAESSAKGPDAINPDSDERLFDVSDLQEVSRCGRIHTTFDYNPTRARLNVTIHEASEIPNQDRGGSTSTQVRLTLLPAKNARHKTKIIRDNENPKYDETFQFKVPKEELNRSGLRLRLYGCERLARERMIGECIIRFVNLGLDAPSSHWLTLEPRASLAQKPDSERLSLGRQSRSGSAASSSSQSMDLEGFSELLLSLAYNAVTGRLTVEVLQGTNLKYLSTNRPPDTYVRLTLMSAGGKELTHSNTSVRKMSQNPVFREKFMFQVVESQLAEVSLMISVYAKRSLKREELIGWFILGYSNSGEDELAHWNDMRSSGGDQVERWHVLAEP